MICGAEVPMNKPGFCCRRPYALMMLMTSLSTNCSRNNIRYMSIRFELLEHIEMHPNTVYGKTK